MHVYIYITVCYPLYSILLTSHALSYDVMYRMFIGWFLSIIHCPPTLSLFFNASREMSQLKRSHPVHDFYVAMESGTATCKTCQRSIASLNSTNLDTHLKLHKAVYEQYELQLTVYKKTKQEKSQGKKKFDNGRRQTTIEEILTTPSVWTADHPKAIELHDQVAKMIVIDGLPFSVSYNFRHLFFHQAV